MAVSIDQELLMSKLNKIRLLMENVVLVLVFDSDILDWHLLILFFQQYQSYTFGLPTVSIVRCEENMMEWTLTADLSNLREEQVLSSNDVDWWRVKVAVVDHEVSHLGEWLGWILRLIVDFIESQGLIDGGINIDLFVDACSVEDRCHLIFCPLRNWMLWLWRIVKKAFLDVKDIGSSSKCVIDKSCNILSLNNSQF